MRKRQCATKRVVQLQKSGTSLNRQIANFGLCISTKNGFFVRNIASLNVYWKTVYVYARSIRYATDFLFFDSRQRKDNASFDELIMFLNKQFCRPPTVICLIKRAADNLINFQAVVKKKLSKFELLKCCRISQQRS